MTPTKVSDLRFASSKHRYTDPRLGIRQPFSVSQIAGSFDDGDKAGRMAGAAVKIALSGGNYRAQWNAKAQTGVRLHLHAKNWAEGRSIEVLPEDVPRVNALAAFYKAKKPEWLYAETDVVGRIRIPCLLHPDEPDDACPTCWGGWGGRFDLIGYFDGLYWLIDIKTGKPYPKELTLQLAGYAAADGIIRYDTQGNAVSIETMPHIDRWAGLYLSDEGVATLCEVPSPTPTRSIEEGQRKAKEAFLHLLEVHRTMKEL